MRTDLFFEPISAPQAFEFGLGTWWQFGDCIWWFQHWAASRYPFLSQPGISFAAQPVRPVFGRNGDWNRSNRFLQMRGMC